jgi:actin-related protein
MHRVPPSPPPHTHTHTHSIKHSITQAPAVFNVNAAVAALYANNMTTGLVAYMGEHTSLLVPVFEGYAKRSITTAVQVPPARLGQFLLHLIAADPAPTVAGATRAVEQLCRGVCPPCVVFCCMYMGVCACVRVCVGSVRVVTCLGAPV